MPSMYRGLLESAVDLRNKQTVDYIYTLPLSVAVPAGLFTAPGVARNPHATKAYIVCDEDADFRVEGITGTVIALTDATGTRQGGSGFGQSLFPVPLSDNSFSERGLLFRIYSGKTERYLIGSEGVNAEAYANFKNHFNPGYRPGGFLAPVRFPFYVTRGSKLTFEFLNTDVVANEPFGGVPLYHFVKINLVGKKMWTRA